jgi:hypothetical protein
MARFSKPLRLSRKVRSGARPRRSFRPVLEQLERRLVPSTYYVDNTNPSASDSGPGSPSQPFSHIQTGANHAVAGDTVLVVAGSYSENVTMPNSGTSTAPILMETAPGATVTVSGQSDGFSISSKSWITIQGFHVTQTSSNGIYVSGSSNITLDGNEVSYAGLPQSGLTARGI